MRCAECGKGRPRIWTRIGGKVLGFCSQECRRRYEKKRIIYEYELEEAKH